jgi:hypothetical protein
MSSDTEIEEEYIPTNIRYDDNPTNEIVTSPKGGIWTSNEDNGLI